MRHLQNLYFLFQIDLFISTQVEGITIFNWKEVNVMHSDWQISSYQRGMGVYNFTLGYSLNNVKPENYLKTQVGYLKSLLLCLVCLPGSSLWFSGSSSRCCVVVCGL